VDGDSLRLCLLHYFGVHTRFRHQPGVAREERYGRRILGGLIEEVDRRAELPFLGLYVDPANPARGLYEEYGFRSLDEWPDPEEEGRPWIRMLREIQPRS
jgi:ribosomal protein S18 acetylase RimI-like enzyme